MPIQDNKRKPETAPSPEVMIQPEAPKEAPVKIEVEKKPEIITPSIEKAEVSEAPAVGPETTAAEVTAPAPATGALKSETLEKIEDILEEDLEEIYFKLPEEKKAEFKKTGEETATQIEKMLSGVKVKVKKVLELIIRWLKIIPGVNHFFLEQEAKIKTDEILKLREEKRGKEGEI